jgi:hypothetical protein
LVATIISNDLNRNGVPVGRPPSVGLSRHR